MASENQIQKFVHALEEGGWVKWVQLSALVAVCIAAFTYFIFDPQYWGLFKGLSHQKGMEQAEIAREIARGHGFSTKMIRPAALQHFKENKGSIPIDNLPDTYHAPLWPTVLAPFLLTVKSTWLMTTKDLIYTPDRMVAGVAAGFLLLSALVNYYSIRRLFDHLLAIYTTGLVLICDVLWKYSLSGLPQMLMLFLFSLGVYTLIRAVENEVAEKPPTLWLAATAVIFGLLALTHGITIWLFAGLLIFCGIYFKARTKHLLIMLGIFLLMYGPWLVRNQMVSGFAPGASWYSALFQIRGTESSIMRDMEFRFEGVSPVMFRNKIQSGVSDQLGRLFDLLGRCVVAPIFFLALLHIFKRKETAVFRWALLSMWLIGLLGMAVYGSDDDGNVLSANDLHCLFIPMFAAYGFAFLLVLWTRLEINVSLVQKALFQPGHGQTEVPALAMNISG